MKLNAFLDEDLLKSSGLIFGASLAGSVILLISNLVLSKHFGPESFGNYKTLVSVFAGIARVWCWDDAYQIHSGVL